MENLNAEQIKKALECCTSESSKCADCPRYSFVPCTKSLLTDALALITSQEQRIKELAEEVESLKQAMEHEHASFMETFGEYGEKCDKLTEENERLRAECTQLIRYPTLYEALKAIIWYDGHYEWLQKLCEGLEKAKSEGKNYPNPIEEWHTENHTIMMLLIGMFGDWGTSIRSGWIEKHDECIAFIKEITKEMLEEGVT